MGQTYNHIEEKLGYTWENTFIFGTITVILERNTVILRLHTVKTETVLVGDNIFIIYS